MSNFSDRLKELRIEKGILQRELADYLKVSRVTITQYETGNRTPDDEIKIKIAKYFNVSLDYLMGISDVKNPYKDNKDVDVVDEFLLDLKKEAKKRGIEFDENSVDDLLDLYEFIKSREDK
mgnify:CR=1 FL=1